MKSRLRYLPPELQALVTRELDIQSRMERGYITQQILQLALYVLASPPYDWGKKRLEDFWAACQTAIDDLVDRYGYDCWADKIVSDLKRKNIEFSDDGWVAERTQLRALAAKADPSKIPDIPVDHEKALEDLKKLLHTPAPAVRKR